MWNMSDVYISDKDVFITVVDKGTYQFAAKGKIYIGSKQTMEEVAKQYNKEKLLEDFFDMLDYYDDGCYHEWHKYEGLVSRDLYCVHCNEKKEWED
jgi:hypothetical protein